MKKEEFNITLKDIGLSRQEFADMTGLSYGSVSNWNNDKQPVPAWVKSWLENYIGKKKFDNIREIIKDEV